MNQYEKYDIQAIISDTNTQEVLNILGIPVKNQTKSTSVLCPMHNDRHFGNAYISEFYKNGNIHKGIYCYACSKYISVETLVMNFLGLSYIDAIRWLADLNGGISQYIINGADNDTNDIYNSNTNNYEQNLNVKAKSKKCPLTQEEMELLDLCGYTDNKKDTFSSTVSMDNLSVIPPTQEDLKNFIVISHPRDNIDKEYIYITRHPENKMNLNILYSEDKEAYFYVVINRIADKIAEIDATYDEIKLSTDEMLVGIKYALQDRRQKLGLILKNHIRLYNKYKDICSKQIA